jgi:hypothetical protein
MISPNGNLICTSASKTSIARNYIRSLMGVNLSDLDWKKTALFTLGASYDITGPFYIDK